MHACGECEGEYDRPAYRDNHVLVVHRGKRPFACTMAGCGQKYGYPIDLARHRQREHENGGGSHHSCPVHGCDKTYSRKSTLNTHLRKKHEVDTSKTSGRPNPAPNQREHGHVAPMHSENLRSLQIHQGYLPTGVSYGNADLAQRPMRLTSRPGQLAYSSASYQHIPANVRTTNWEGDGGQSETDRDAVLRQRLEALGDEMRAIWVELNDRIHGQAQPHLGSPPSSAMEETITDEYFFSHMQQHPCPMPISGSEDQAQPESSGNRDGHDGQDQANACEYHSTTFHGSHHIISHHGISQSPIGHGVQDLTFQSDVGSSSDYGLHSVSNEVSSWTDDAGQLSPSPPRVNAYLEGMRGFVGASLPGLQQAPRNQIRETLQEFDEILSDQGPDSPIYSNSTMRQHPRNQEQRQIH